MRACRRWTILTDCPIALGIVGKPRAMKIDLSEGPLIKHA
jgi:hypothetical protein